MDLLGWYSVLPRSSQFFYNTDCHNQQNNLKKEKITPKTSKKLQTSNRKYIFSCFLKVIWLLIRLLDVCIDLLICTFLSYVIKFNLRHNLVGRYRITFMIKFSNYVKVLSLYWLMDLWFLGHYLFLFFFQRR